ncbi:MAG TPA: nitroreductase family protein [Candidatus Limnocylindria bacterium]|nr:nitroreductase family protein [Candidatus Limnocylindria bacterium]
METWQAINSVRVVRQFDDRPLRAEEVDRILNAGRRAGSSKNEQRWTFIVIRERDHLRDLSRVGGYAGHLARAAIAVALVSPDPASPAQAASIMWDLGRAAQNMVLAAWELRIGSVPATVYDLELVARLLGLPPGQRCHFLLSFGYPADPSVLTAPNRPGGRQPLDQIVREERW